MAEIYRKRNIVFMVDAVSSVGGIALPIDQWGVWKHSPGLLMVAVNERAWTWKGTYPDGISTCWIGRLPPNPGENVQPYHITMAVNNVRVLRIAVERILLEGLEARFKRHNFALGTTGARLEINGKWTGSLEGCDGVYCPDGHHDMEIVDFLRKSCGIQIIGGLGDLREKTVGANGPFGHHHNANVVLNGIAHWLKSANLLGRRLYENSGH